MTSQRQFLFPWMDSLIEFHFVRSLKLDIKILFHTRMHYSRIIVEHIEISIKCLYMLIRVFIWARKFSYQ